MTRPQTGDSQGWLLSYRVNELGARVLIVDDEPLVASALARALRQLGCVVESHSSPKAALERLEAAAPQVVLSDLHMPQMRGTAFLCEVKKRVPEASRGLVSALMDDVSEAEWGLVRPCAVIGKPWTEAELLAAVHGAGHFER